MLLNPCITSIPDIMATLFIGLFGDDKGHWGRVLTGIYTMGHLSTLLLKSFRSFLSLSVDCGELLMRP